MSLGVDLSANALEEIVERVTQRVLAELISCDRFPAQGTRSPYLSVEEAAEYLRCSRQRIDDLLSQRRLSRVKDGRRTLVSRVEIEAYLTASESRRRSS